MCVYRDASLICKVSNFLFIFKHDSKERAKIIHVNTEVWSHLLISPPPLWFLIFKFLCKSYEYFLFEAKICQFPLANSSLKGGYFIKSGLYQLAPANSVHWKFKGVIFPGWLFVSCAPVRLLSA